MRELANHIQYTYTVYYPNSAYDITRLAVSLNPGESSCVLRYTEVWCLIANII